MMAAPVMPDAVPLAPVMEDLRVLSITSAADQVRIRAVVTIDPGNPVFAGHYPGLPVFPGVCQLECAHRTVLAVGRQLGCGPVLESIRAARFLSLVSPGDELTIDTAITATGDKWVAMAELIAPHARTARFVLQYRLPGGGR